MGNKILIVEDSKSVAKTLASLVEEELGYKCILASTMKETADELLKHKGKFEVALLDLSLPDSLNGEVVDFVTKFNIPVVILTGSSLPKDEKRFRKNIVDYVIKDGLYSFKYAISVVKRIIYNSKIKVLIVDDSKTFTEATKDLVQRYRLIPFVANNGKEALEIIEENKDIKIVLTDYHMPKMDGLELTRTIRKKFSKDEMSIIVTSSNEDKKTPSKFLKYGANDFLHKNFTEEEFFVRLSANLEILELFEDVKNKANKDFLTGLYNRRYLFDKGRKLYEEYKKDKKDFAIAIIDIDKFKLINDTYGHDIGDIAIKEVSKVINKNIESNFLAARLGGEEFCILIYDKKQDEVKKILNNIKDSFESNFIETEEAKINFTVSIGCSFDFSQSIDHMIQSADKGLYSAKEEGRNRVRYR